MFCCRGKKRQAIALAGQTVRMAMTPLALSLLGVEPHPRRRNTEQHGEATVPEGLQHLSESRPTRPSRRATSYYNSFQTVCSSANDCPPPYAIATRHRPAQRRRTDFGESLPRYTCTVAAEAKVLLQLESINPLHGVSESEWREVYVVLRGTLLSFHRSKDSGPGKLLRSYTLQHAEVGLAPDTQHTVLVPQTRLAHLVPSPARRKAWQRDPDLFRPIRQHILRLRAETDQILLADSSEERIHSLISSIGAGIDISHAIDERSIPRQCTVPRRRRRQRTSQTGDLNDPALLAEQERILRDVYPAFAERTSQTRPQFDRTVTSISDEGPAESQQTSTREEDDLDLAAIREDFASPSATAPGQPGDSSHQPPGSRQATTAPSNSTNSADMMYATSPTNFNSSGKWEPPHTRTPQQVQRYVRRCMPMLLAEAVRASDVLICSGKRVKINWRMELLEEWELQPPSYKSHGFNAGLGLERTRSCSQNSAAESAAHDNAQASTSVLGGEAEDQITRAEDGLANLDLSKIASVGTMDKATPREAATPKTEQIRQPAAEIHGVVFCF